MVNGATSASRRGHRTRGRKKQEARIDSEPRGRASKKESSLNVAKHEKLTSGTRERSRKNDSREEGDPSIKRKGQSDLFKSGCRNLDCFPPLSTMGIIKDALPVWWFFYFTDFFCPPKHLDLTVQDGIGWAYFSTRMDPSDESQDSVGFWPPQHFLPPSLMSSFYF